MSVFKKDMTGHDYFESLFKTYYHRLLGVANAYVDADIAEDMVQEVFLSLWKDKERALDETTLKSYLYVAIRNRCFNYLRDHKEKNRISLDGIDNENDFFEEQVMEEEIIVKLYQAITKLPSPCDEIFRSVLSGNSDKDIALQLGLTIDSVKSHKKRGRALLKSLLEKQLFSFFIF